MDNKYYLYGLYGLHSKILIDNNRALYIENSLNLGNCTKAMDPHSGSSAKDRMCVAHPMKQFPLKNF